MKLETVYNLQAIPLIRNFVAETAKSGMAAAMQGCLLLGSVAVGSAMISALMSNFPNLLTIHIFAALTFVIAILTFISAVDGSKSLV